MTTIVLVVLMVAMAIIAVIMLARGHKVAALEAAGWLVLFTFLLFVPVGWMKILLGTVGLVALLLFGARQADKRAI